MSRGYRLLFVALAGLILTAAEQPKEQAQAGGSAHYEQAPPTETASPSPTAKPTYGPYPGYQPDPCYNAEDHDAADLCAQWRAALAAEKAAHEARRATTWMIVATIFSLLTLAGLIVTIAQTYGALGEARRSNLIAQRSSARATRQAIASAKEASFATNAMRKANKIAIDAHQRQLRAYVSIHPDKKNVIVIEAGKPLCVLLSVRNNGQTPALNCNYQYTAGVVEKDWSWSEEHQAKRDADRQGALHNGDPVMLQLKMDRDITKEEIAGIQAGLCVFVGRAVFFYDDVFGDEHVTQITIEIDAEAMERGTPKQARAGQIAT